MASAILVSRANDMSPSYLVLGFGVLNLLLAAAGLLLVYFDWSAARRREFLYLSFSEEKPGVNYFAAARRRRTQYTRLLAAFFVLLVREFLAVVLYAQVTRPDQWKGWVSWWMGHNVNYLNDTDAIVLAIRFWSWVTCLSIFGLTLLGFGLLYEPHDKRESRTNALVGTFLVVWVLFSLGVSANVLRSDPDVVAGTAAAIYRVTPVLRFVILGSIMFGFMRRKPESVERGMLAYDPATMVIAFSFWLVGSILGDLLYSPAIFPMGQCVTYLALVAIIAKGVLAEYESVESSRHRMGRERQVIFSFLQRIGLAFTKELQFDQVLRIVLDTALETSEASAGAIYFYHPDTGILDPRVVRGFFPPLHVDTPAAMSAHRTEELQAEMEHQSFRLGEGVVGEVAQSGVGRIIEDVKHDGIMLGTTTDFMRNKSMVLVPLRIRDEPLGVMAVLNKQRGSFGKDDLSLLQALADQGALSINHALLTLEIGRQERLRRDLQIAHDIQQRMLPKECPVVPGFKIAARGTPATEVGGDYYDFFWVDNDHLGIVVADVSGKGVPAALTVATIRSAFRTLAQGNPNVREVLSRVNDFMSMDMRRDMFITCVYGILEIPTRRFSWARAGHEPLIVTHPDAETDVLSPVGFALGVVMSPDFSDALEVNTVELHSGDRLLLFTGGLTEAMNASGEEFGMQRILDVMNHLPVHVSRVNGTAEGLTAMGADGGTRIDGATRTLTAVAPAVTQTTSTTAALNGAADDSEDLESIERAVQDHVAGAPPSDDLTIVYLCAD